MFLGKQLFNCLWHLKFEVVFFIFVLDFCTLENIKAALNFKHFLNPIKARRDNDWALLLTRRFLFQPALPWHFGQGNRVCAYLSRVGAYVVNYAIQTWCCFTTDSDKRVNYAKGQQSIKKTQESGRKKPFDSVRKLFLSANTSVLKAHFAKSICNFFSLLNPFFLWVVWIIAYVDKCG